MVTVPPDTPVTEPVVGTATLPIALLLLLHVPPPVPSDNVIVTPTHTCDAPLIAPGNGLTVIGAVMWQPVGKV